MNQLAVKDDYDGEEGLDDDVLQIELVRLCRPARAKRNHRRLTLAPGTVSTLKSETTACPMSTPGGALAR
jgi:hypothetical protein